MIQYMPILTGITKDKITITLDFEILKWVDKQVKTNDDIPSRSYLISKSVRDAKKRMDKK